MTETTKIVFERFQIRKTKPQKRAFSDFVGRVATNSGYLFTPETIGSSTDLVVGDPYNADVIFTAHYDTCPRLPLPNFITPKNLLIYIIYQIALSAVILFPFFAVLFFPIIMGNAGFEIFYDLYPIFFLLSYALLFVILYFLKAGPANKHTANDNTSGVTVLLDLMQAMPRELRPRAAFIFFDNEEVGLLGSKAYVRKHWEAMKHKLLINFDCVSDGNNILFAVKKNAAPQAEVIRKAFDAVNNGDFNVDVATKGVFYPSDQMLFPKGVGVAALKKSKKLGVLYMDKIHTSKDTVYEEKNIEFLVRGSINLTSALSAHYE
ncbi:MAG: M28 family peptidase [Clostridia bacterium]|nr:M28 family peptidase [Clostridia bacterium]